MERIFSAIEGVVAGMALTAYLILILVLLLFGPGGLLVLAATVLRALAGDDD